MIKQRNLFVLFIISLPLLANALALGDSGISFEPPAGFKILSDDLIKSDFEKNNAPQWAYTNDDASVSVAIKQSNTPLAIGQLNALLKSTEDTLPKSIPNLVWIKKEIIKSNGVTWMHIEFTNTTIDSDIHNNFYMTSYKGFLLAFNFNSTGEQYKKYRKKLQKSFASIHLTK